MKNYKIMIHAFLILFLGALPSAHAEKTGNGGVGYACKASPADSAYSSIELLDLHEAKDPRLLNLPINKPYATRDEALAAIRSKLVANHPEFTRIYDVFVADILKDIQSTKYMLSPGDRLPLYLGDVNPRYLKVNCEFIQLARYDAEKNHLEVVYDYFNSPLFSPTDQAALIVHEVFYKISRIFAQQLTSAMARKAVGYVLTDAKIPGLDVILGNLIDNKKGIVIAKLDPLDGRLSFEAKLGASGVNQYNSCAGLLKINRGKDEVYSFQESVTLKQADRIVFDMNRAFGYVDFSGTTWDLDLVCGAGAFERNDQFKVERVELSVIQGGQIMGGRPYVFERKMDTGGLNILHFQRLIYVENDWSET